MLVEAWGQRELRVESAPGNIKATNDRVVCEMPQET
jgi:hypothetical protein